MLEKNELLNFVFKVIIGIFGLSLIIIGIIASTAIETIVNTTWPVFLAGGVFILLSILTILHRIYYLKNKNKKEKANSEEEYSEQQKDNNQEVQ